MILTRKLYFLLIRLEEGMTLSKTNEGVTALFNDVQHNFSAIVQPVEKGSINRLISLHLVKCSNKGRPVYRISKLGEKIADRKPIYQDNLVWLQ